MGLTGPSGEGFGVIQGVRIDQGIGAGLDRLGGVANGGDGNAVAQSPPSGSFKDMLVNAIEEVNSFQLEANAMSEKLVTGEIQDVSQVMVASQKAELSLQMAIQVRNKILEAYQEIMRMPV